MPLTLIGSTFCYRSTDTMLLRIAWRLVTAWPLLPQGRMSFILKNLDKMSV